MVDSAEITTPLPAASRTTGIQGWKRNEILTVTVLRPGVPMPELYQMYPVLGVVGVDGQLAVCAWPAQGSVCRLKPPPSLLCTAPTTAALLGSGVSKGMAARVPSRAASEMVL